MTEERPRLVYFRWPLDNYPPYNQRLFERLMVGGLSAHFDLVVVEGECDYDAVCDRHQPDLCLLESGNNNYVGPHLRVHNTHTHPHVPKLGFLRADPMSPSRTTFLAEMDRWGIDTFFTFVTSAAEAIPEVADRMFYWPFFIDPAIYRDWGHEKLLPILLLGQTDSPQYPWRTGIRRALSPRFQTVVLPHVGYDPKVNSQALYDERFSRLINSAQITPTCGAMVRVLVNKHLEIAASGSLLLTEDTPAVRAFGFEHMVNCVFATEADAADVVAHLFAHPDEMARITRAGHAHVHAHHTVQQRTQLRQWLALSHARRDGQRIVQYDPCGDLVLVPDHVAARWSPFRSDSVDRALLGEAWACVDRRDLAGARARFDQCLAFTPYMAAPRLGLATCALLAGVSADAVRLLGGTVEMTLAYGGTEPDPIEWGTFLIALLCEGAVDDAVREAARFGSVHREELDWARWAVYTVARDARRADSALAAAATPGLPRRASMHPRAPRDFGAQVREWMDMLRACRRHPLAGLLEAALRRRERTAA